MTNKITNKNILLIITGGIAAYKSLELIRLLKRNGNNVTCILTESAKQFVTEMSVSALSENPVYSDLWSLKDEREMGHIRLSREADLILVAPATANFIAKMAHGLCDDLASTVLLAADKPIILAPAMNHKMWEHPATQDNLKTLKKRGTQIIPPAEGDMACGEYGMGRMAEPEEILQALSSFLQERQPLTGMKALVTSGPTYEPIDPVRFLGNRSSGKQGHAIASALAAQGADVTLVTGPVALPDPPNMHVIHVETGVEMLDAARKTLPADIAVFAAAVSDWSAATIERQKIKKTKGKMPPDLKLKENPDILATLARPSPKRPKLVIGFAAESENIIEFAAKKLNTKNADWILANKVTDGQGQSKVFGEDKNHVFFLTAAGHEDWKEQSKEDIASTLVRRISEYFENSHPNKIAAE